MLETDSEGNTALHYAYDLDLPVIRTLLKTATLNLTRERNNRGLIPRQMMHDANYESSESSDEGKDDEMVANHNESLAKKAAKKQQQIETYIYERNNRHRNAGNSKLREDGSHERSISEFRVPMNLRKSLFKHPIYCYVVSRKSLNVIEFELDSLIKTGGCYYEEFDRLNSPDQVIIVIFFEQSLIDLLAEVQYTMHKLGGYDCLIEFKAFAGDDFEKFNGR